MAEKIKLTIAGILADLKAGLDRKQIKAKYGLSSIDLKRVFQHDKLKGRKVSPLPNFELIDDTTDDTAEASEGNGQQATASAAVSNVANTPAPDQVKEPAKQAAGDNKGVW